MSRRRRPPSTPAPRRRSLIATTREVVVAVVVVVGATAMLAVDATTEDDQLDVQPAASSVVLPAAPAPAVASATAAATSDGTAAQLTARDVARIAEAEAVAVAAAAAAQRDAMWERLADCESGRWDPERRPIAGTARWDYGLHASEDGFFQGGLQFHPTTWDEFRDADMPDHAGYASRDQQIAVAERVLDRQGWRAWPVCSKRLGYR